MLVITISKADISFSNEVQSSAELYSTFAEVQQNSTKFIYHLSMSHWNHRFEIKQFYFHT